MNSLIDIYSDMSITKGDALVILAAPINGWILVQLGNNVGLVPLNYIKILSNNANPGLTL